jgi:glutathione S-transferase
MAEELGIAYEQVQVETGPAGARKPDYLAINPNGRLPAIDDDGFVMWESQAINLYLAKKYGRAPLYPAAIEGEAKAWQWSLWAANEVERITNIWSLHALRLPPEDRDAPTVEKALAILAAPFAVLNRTLDGQAYLLGPDFSVADLNVAAVLARAHEMDLAKTPHVADWLRRCLDRPAGKKALGMRQQSDGASSIESIRSIAKMNRL